MPIEPPAPPTRAPERLFRRAGGVAAVVGLAVVVGTHAMLGLAAARQALTAERAVAATSEVAAARAVVVALERLDAVPPGAEARTERTRLAWDVARLMAEDGRRLAATPGVEAGADPLAAAAIQAEAHAAGSPAGVPLAELEARFEARILPQLELIATDAAGAARAGAARLRALVLGALALQLATAAALVLGVVAPAGRRIAAASARARKEASESRFRLMHDPLTGLPNAAHLQAALARIAAAGGRARTETAVLRLDFDRFRAIRDALGQACAEEVLRIAAQRIRKALRAGDFAAYLGHDDFVVVATELGDASQVAAIALRLQAALGRPFSLRGGARRLGVGVGVTLVSDDRPEAERILANADIALAAARAAGSGQVRYFRDDLRVAAERREALFAELVAGLDGGAIVPFFQPQVELASGRLAGFEALVRWRHPDQGLLEPAAFLDFAEQSDLTERIGEQVLTGSLEALRAWDAAGFEVPRVGVNFALAQLVDPRLVEKIKWETERFGVEPSRIAIEVLETVLIKGDAGLVARNLRGLASAGFHVELDDFGTGHASIANLRRFMVNRIKIDRSFVVGIEESEEQQALTGSMIAMAHALGVGTLAEGVETGAALEVLRRLGCDQVQGYLVAAPMPQADTLGWLAAFRAGTDRSARRPRGPAGDPN